MEARVLPLNDRRMAEGRRVERLHLTATVFKTDELANAQAFHGELDEIRTRDLLIDNQML